MAKISLTYPDTGLTVNVSVYINNSETLDNSGVANEIGTTGVYVYTFTADGVNDYTYKATVAGYNDLSGPVFNEVSTGGGGGASVSDIWTAQIGDYSGTPGSFANKFEQYGGVSHVIDRSQLDEESRKSIQDIQEEFKKTKDAIGNMIKDIKPQVVSEGKTTVVKYNDAQQNFIQEFITETIPELADKIDNLIPLLKTYEELILDFEQKEKDYERLIEELINNK